MAQKFVAPNTIFDSSVAFLKQVNFDSSIKLGSVILSSVDTSVAGLSQSETALATSAAVYSYVNQVAGGKDEFNELLDVSVGTRANGDLVTYNSVTSTWDNASIASLDLATLTYVDGSLSARDTSIANLVTITDNLDTSIGALDTLTQTHTIDIAQLDASIVRTDAYQAVQDTSIAASLAGSAQAWNGLTKTDNSIGWGGDLTDDVNIGLGGAAGEFSIDFNQQIDSLSFTNTGNGSWGPGGTLTFSPTGNFKAATSGNLSLSTDSGGDVSINTTGDIYLDAASIFIDDVGIATVDTSTEGLSQLDTAIATSGAIYSYVNSQITAGAFVKKSGDTMTGPLNITGGGLKVGTIGSPQDVSIYSQLYVHGTTTIGGDLNIDGSLFVRDVESIDVSSSFIKLNTGETGSPPASMQSGIIVERGVLNPYVFLYDESTQEFRVGIAPETAGPSYDDASTQAVATREDTPTVNGIGFWNGTSSRIDTDASLVFSTTTGLTIGGPAITMNNLDADGAEQTGVLIDAAGKLVTREFGTLAFEDVTSFASLTYVDGSLAARDTSIANLVTITDNLDTSIGALDTLTQTHTIDIAQLDASVVRLDAYNAVQDGSISALETSIQDLSTGKLDAVASTTGVSGHEVYSGEADNVGYIKRLIAGTGASMISDASTVTISVTGAAGYMSKYTDTFDGTSGTTLSIAFGTHGLTNDTSTLMVSVFDENSQVFPEISVDKSTAAVTLDWTLDSLGANCRYLITG